MTEIFKIINKVYITHMIDNQEMSIIRDMFNKMNEILNLHQQKFTSDGVLLVIIIAVFTVFLTWGLRVMNRALNYE